LDAGYTPCLVRIARRLTDRADEISCRPRRSSKLHAPCAECRR
jgi:hypothetical protein